MITIRFEEARFKYPKEYLNFSQGEPGVRGRKRWYSCYVDTPDKRFGEYKIVIVKQRAFFWTLEMLLHELLHIVINVVYGEGDVGDRIHNKYDRVSFKVKKMILKG